MYGFLRRIPNVREGSLSDFSFVVFPFPPFGGQSAKKRCADMLAHTHTSPVALLQTNRLKRSDFQCVIQSFSVADKEVGYLKVHIPACDSVRKVYAERVACMGAQCIMAEINQ